MLLKKLVGIAVFGFIFFTGTAQAYDLPKILPDKKVTEKNSAEVTENDSEELPKNNSNKVPNDKSLSASDWTNTELFEQKLKKILAENKNLPASSKERVNRDKNLVFVAFYKGNAYFLDRYSIRVLKKSSQKRSWRQHIFPIGKKISPKNSAKTLQKFCFHDNKFYNSSGTHNEISKVENEEDKNFLTECFKVGYYYAFKKEIDVQ